MLKTIQSIRSVDQLHMILIEGDYYSLLFEGIDLSSDPNIVLSNHNYISVSLGSIKEYPGILDGVQWDKSQIEKQFEKTEGYRVAKAFETPLLVSEFGFNHFHASDKSSPQITGFEDQLITYNEYGAHWTFWTYKDLGRMGWVQVNPESDYIQAVKPLLDAKTILGTDFGWLDSYPDDVETHIQGLSQIISSLLPGVDATTNRRYFAQAAMSTYTADQLQWLYIQSFIHRSETQMDEILKSFEIKNCIQNPALNRILETQLKS